MLRDQLIELLQPVVVQLGYELWELEYAARSGGGLLRLYIDAPQGITLEDCERVSRAVSEAMDASDPIPGHYTLEVSSPGLDRVLRTAEHFARFSGERVKVETSAPVNGRKRFAGRLTGVSNGEIALDVDGSVVKLPIDGIHKARIAPET
ncbi:MAG TPA: ribosome maturation factor RimP [Povalibacter sp.]|uniref:ribosome maturation factor RimP n=1 Tax=Povalibacter sp. TaxID=1962978 RepID=UPI002C433E51|nr:ribosome maturation factor RimP [Povalibacter sp.]HMN45717.1 ribosome maturation factor RimP [Povalibacter sp.]